MFEEINQINLVSDQTTEPIENFTNYDLDNIITSVNVFELDRLLKLTDYDLKETRFLVNGFREGFDIGYKGPENRRDFSGQYSSSNWQQENFMEQDHERGERKKSSWTF